MIEPHEVSRDDVEILTIICGKCGNEIQGDGDWFWHIDEDLNPKEDNK